MSEFTDYLNELFEPFGPVSIRRMFGGYGLYHADIMFALVYQDTLYLKADKSLAAEFISRKLPAFEYQQSGKKVTLHYYQAPAEVLDDSEQAAEWAKKSFQVALVAHKLKSRKAKVV